MSNNPIYDVVGNDPELVRAAQAAHDNFRYFWREMTWEQRRIVPACEVAAVKARFTDESPPGLLSRFFGRGGEPPVEQMWVGDVDFDGHTIHGRLLNQPRDIRSLSAGDAVRFPLERMTDWMYCIDGVVYGAYSVNVMRRRMNGAERREHDAAWGYEFGDPRSIVVVPAEWGHASPDDEHPMSKNMVPKLMEAVEEHRGEILDAAPDGWSQLHHMALGGNLSPVRVLLDAGADPTLKTPAGDTAADLASRLGWEDVAALLAR